MELNTYDSSAGCPKCGCGEVSSRYHSEEYGCWKFDKRLFRTEHICRYCKRCGFAWPEACIGEAKESKLGVADYEDFLSKL